MIKHYIVTGVKVRFAPGFVLDLDKDQASSRSHVLHHKRHQLYAVLDTVEFKQGEVIGIAEGEIPKSWWDTLKEVETKKAKTKVPEPQTGNTYTLKHRYFGKYDVLGPDGVAVTEEPLVKEEALALQDKLIGGTEV